MVAWYSIFRITHLISKEYVMKKHILFFATFILLFGASAFSQGAPPTKGQVVTYLAEQGPHRGELAGWRLHFSHVTVVHAPAENTLSDPARFKERAWIVTAKHNRAAVCYGASISSPSHDPKRFTMAWVMASKTFRVSGPRACTSRSAPTFEDWLDH